MMLTTSDNDSEALAALRKANAHLKKNGHTWQDIFRAFAEAVAILRKAAADDDDDDDAAEGERGRLWEALRAAQASAGSESFRLFMKDLATQLAAKGSLSPKQRAAVFKSARRAGWRG